MVQIEFIGKTTENRDMVLVKISSDHSAKKPIIFFEAGIHGREWLAPTSAMYMIDQLVHNITHRHVLDCIDFYIIPLSNPDGYEYSREYVRIQHPVRWPQHPRKSTRSSYLWLLSVLRLLFVGQTVAENPVEAQRILRSGRKQEFRLSLEGRRSEWLAAKWNLQGTDAIFRTRNETHSRRWKKIFETNKHFCVLALFRSFHCLPVGLPGGGRHTPRRPDGR